VRGRCYAWDEHSAATWRLAHDGRPGRLWVLGTHEDETFNRVESTGVLLTSDALTDNPFEVSLPWTPTLLGDLSGFVTDLSVGPQTTDRDAGRARVPGWGR
jgi:hypothetical protein